MTSAVPALDAIRQPAFPFPARHFLSVADLDPPTVGALLDLADEFVALNRQKSKKLDLLKGRTLINLFFEASTRTQSSFELAGKRLGADVVNMSPRASSLSKVESRERRAFWEGGGDVEKVDDGHAGFPGEGGRTRDASRGA